MYAPGRADLVFGPMAIRNLQSDHPWLRRSNVTFSSSLPELQEASAYSSRSTQRSTAKMASVTSPAFSQSSLEGTPAGAKPVADSTANSELLVPLSFGDRLAGVEHAATLLGWVVPRSSLEEGLDSTKLESALGRVGEKWRLLAGRVEMDQASESSRGREVPRGRDPTNGGLDLFHRIPSDPDLARVTACESRPARSLRTTKSPPSPTPL